MRFSTAALVGARARAERQRAAGRADVRFADVQRVAQPQRCGPVDLRPVDAEQRPGEERGRDDPARPAGRAPDQRVRLRRAGTSRSGSSRTTTCPIAQNGAAPIVYPYRFTAESNTGIPSGFDLNNNGVVGGPDDAFGFGFFPGQFGMAVYSMYPIDTTGIRTFQKFLWKDMPGRAARTTRRRPRRPTGTRRPS